MKKFIITLIITIPLFGAAQTQFHLSQYMMHRTFINVAAMGSMKTTNGALFHKNQWTGFDGAPTFQGLNVALPVSVSNTVGMTFVNDQIGVNHNMNLAFNYAYRVKTSADGNLIFGTSVALNMMQSNYAEIQTEMGVDPLFSQNTPMIMRPNFNFGTYYHTDKFHVGFAIPNLLNNSIEYNDQYGGTTEFDPSKMHFYLHSGYRFEPDEGTVLEPFVLIKQVSGAPVQVDLNMMATFNGAFGAGLGYRTSNELAIMANYNIKGQFTIGYAYDLSFSDLSNYSSGSHEIMLIYRKPDRTSTASLETDID